MLTKKPHSWICRCGFLGTLTIAMSVCCVLASADEALEEVGFLNDQLLGAEFSEQTGPFVAGWIDQGFTWNPDSPADRFNGYVINNDRANEYQLNQCFLTLQRDADQESAHVSFGARTDMLYGTDAYLFQALGWDDSTVSDEDSRFYKLAIPQCYGEVYMPIGNGLLVTVGKWSSLIGYEYGLGSRDFFYSHSLAFNFTPYTHTGVFATYALTDQWEVSQGFHRGADLVEDNNNNLSYIGCTTWTAPSEDWSLYFALTAGPEQDERADWQDLDGAPGPDAPGENLNQVISTLTFSTTLTERFDLALNQDLFFQEGNDSAGLEQSEAYGGSAYLTYEVGPAWSWGARLEIIRDDDGFVSEGFLSLIHI